MFLSDGESLLIDGIASAMRRIVATPLTIGLNMRALDEHPSLLARNSFAPIWVGKRGFCKPDTNALPTDILALLREKAEPNFILQRGINGREFEAPYYTLQSSCLEHRLTYYPDVGSSVSAGMHDLPIYYYPSVTAKYPSPGYTAKIPLHLLELSYVP